MKPIQEWLTLQGFHVVIDGKFGPATSNAVRQFQKANRLRQDGIVGMRTFKKLTLPMSEALRSISATGKKLGDMIVAHASQHLEQHPREVGGQNKGPWIRLYMQENEGSNWPWCAGFASFMLKQACGSLHLPLPIEPSFSCDYLAMSAMKQNLFWKESAITLKDQITRGSFFLVRRTPTDWIHVGIVISARSDEFDSIEGNTNDDGEREGYEACQRIRNYEMKDFIVFS